MNSLLLLQALLFVYQTILLYVRNTLSFFGRKQYLSPDQQFARQGIQFNFSFMKNRSIRNWLDLLRLIRTWIPLKKTESFKSSSWFLRPKYNTPKRFFKFAQSINGLSRSRCKQNYTTSKLDKVLIPHLTSCPIEDNTRCCLFPIVLC